MNPLSSLAAIARTQLGTQEDAAHTNRGAAILKYQQATNLGGQGWAWCAAFVDWCVEQFLASNAPVRVSRPKTASAFGLIDWANSNNCLVFNPSSKDFTARAGDIVVYTFSHTGIVSADQDAAGHFLAIEGNTNNDGSRDGYEVAERTRSIDLVKAFIRLPVVAAAV